MAETPKSGVRGITWNKGTGKWMVYCGKKYLGVYSDVDDAIAAKKNYEITQPQKLCKVCGKPIPREWNQRNDYCSNECKKIGKEQYHKERYQSTRPKPRTCVICGQPIPADQNPRAIVCSDACGRIHRQQYQRSYYEQHRHVPVEKRKASPIAGDPTVSIFFSAPASMRDWLLDSANANKESLSKFMRELIQREIDKKEGTE